MNQTKLNTELLADVGGRKHIPLAVFAVIAIHVVLFVVLLIAAGCRSRERARLQNTPPATPQEQITGPRAEVAEPQPPAPETFLTAQPVIATEPMIDDSPAPGPARTAQRALPSRPRAEAVQTYVVQPGDTVGKIAKELGTTIRAIREENQLKNDLIFPGQKLRVTAPKAQRELASI